MFNVGEHLQIQRLTGAQYAPGLRFTRGCVGRHLCGRTNHLAQLLAVHDGGSPGPLHDIAGAQAGFFCSATRNHLANQRLRPRPENADFSEQLRVSFGGAQGTEWQHDASPGAARFISQQQGQIAAIQRALREAPAQIFERTHRLQFIPGKCGLLNHIKAAQPGLFGERAGNRAGQNGLGLLNPGPIDHRIDQNGQQQIGDRPRSHYSGPRFQRLVIESKMSLGRINRAFALVEHLDVSAQGQHSDGKFRRLVFQSPGVDRLAKSDRKFQHLDAASHRNAVVAVFMHGNQNTQRDHEGNQCQHVSTPDVQLVERQSSGNAHPVPAVPRYRVPQRQPPFPKLHGLHDEYHQTSIAWRERRPLRFHWRH